MKNIVTIIFLVISIVCLSLYAQGPDVSEVPENVFDSIAPDEADASAKPNPAPVLPDAGTVDSSSEAETTEPARKKGTFFELLGAGGLIGYIIIMLSVATLALVIEHFLSIRSKILIPPELAEDALGMLAEGRLAEAKALCEDDPSVFAYVLDAGLQEVELGWTEVEKAVENACVEQTARLYRKIDFLSDIGSIAPMLGLLGTVVGMVVAFREMAISDGSARAPELAEGIYLALVTTVEGLIVAIPAMAFYSFFRNRISYLMAETAFLSEQVLHPLKRSLMKGTANTTPNDYVPPVLK